ncbi:hypothetical protein V5G24_22780 [Xanthobacter sp. VTT E-85241]|uniref:hypothetical protein n=1 Tax=Roseixanthobacter finlandensis TaxID=3119922 RepID=UPI00372B9F2E
MPGTRKRTKNAGQLMICEGSPGQAPADAYDGQDEMLPEEDRVTEAERRAPRPDWLPRQTRASKPPKNWRGGFG